MPATIIRQSRTADNIGLVMMSDGQPVQWHGITIRGIGCPRTDPGRELALRVGNWLFGDLSLYNYGELVRVWRVALLFAKRNPNATPGDFRAAVAGCLKAA